MKIHITRWWYHPSLHLTTFFLLPLSWLFLLSIVIRKNLYRIGLFKTHHFSVPVIVVGNMTVGGTGKTPMVIWLAQYLQMQGLHPGIVTRGVGGKRHNIPYDVKQNY